MESASVEALDFMKAITELSAFGTWQDPELVSNDQREEIIYAKHLIDMVARQQRMKMLILNSPSFPTSGGRKGLGDG